jgi:hypothetical protein
VNELTVDALGRYALYEAFPACEARRVLDRLEFQYVPKHASWLNVVESEIGALRGQYLDRRLQSEILAWERQRNAARARIKWMFTIDKARPKMGRAYSCQADIAPNSKSHNHCAWVLSEPIQLIHQLCAVFFVSGFCQTHHFVPISKPSIDFAVSSNRFIRRSRNSRSSRMPSGELGRSLRWVGRGQE